MRTLPQRTRASGAGSTRGNFGLVLALVLAICVSACSDDSKTTGPQAPPLDSPRARKVVLLRENFFSPEHVTIDYGDTIMWINVGTFMHTATSGSTCESDGLWDSGRLFSGDSYTVVFDSTGVDTTGLIPYYCIPHCRIGMTGTVTILP